MLIVSALVNEPSLLIVIIVCRKARWKIVGREYVCLAPEELIPFIIPSVTIPVHVFILYP